MSVSPLQSGDRVLFVADQYADVARDEVHRYPGGAELTDQAVMEAAPCAVETRTFSNFTPRDLDDASVCIVGNAARARPDQLRVLAEFPRLILFEHDMRICRARGDMSMLRHPLHRALHWCLCRRSEMLELTKGSAGVVFLTEYQKQIFERNPWYPRRPMRVLGCSVFDKATLKKFDAAPVAGDRPIEICLAFSAFRAKGFAESMAHAKTIADNPYVIRNLPPEEVLDVFRRSKRFVHKPPSPEWAGRLPVEARFLGCQVATNEHVGVALEPWWSLDDEAALRVVSGAAGRFWRFVDELLAEGARRD
ncbi:MAG TPA: hypothetical protein PKD61_01690 [Polyangiaceae bacterium]|nr:hypothetical protein [Polyangiaceae bacterium]